MTNEEYMKVMQDIEDIREKTTDKKVLRELDELQIMLFEQMSTDCRGGQCG